MGRAEKSDKSANTRADHRNRPKETATSDDSSERTSTRCSFVSSSLSSASTHYRDFSTISTSTRGKISQNDDQFVLQNLFNKKNERLRKPCQNGFCYCFTSDSDELRFSTQKTRTRHKRPHTEGKIDHVKAEKPVNNKHAKCIETKSKRRITLPPSAEVNLRSEPNECDKYSTETRRHTFISKYTLPEPICSDKDEPLVSIIQKIHRNFVISEISVKKGKAAEKKGKSDESIACPTVNTQIIEPHRTIHIETKNVNSSERTELKHDGESPATPLQEFEKSNENSAPLRPPRSFRKKGGHLLKKRIGDGNSFKQMHLHTPPRKPPRSFSSCSESNAPIKKNFDCNSTIAENEGNNEISVDQNNLLPDKNVFSPKQQNVPSGSDLQLKDQEQHTPTCPPITEMTFSELLNRIEQEMPQQQIGWVQPDIVNMLNYDTQEQMAKVFQSFQPNPQPQSVGWQPPPKLDIDTVDNVPKFRENGFHNFAANMECKSTPVKTELLAENASKISLKQQLLNKTTTCAFPTVVELQEDNKKLSPVAEHKKDSCFGRKAMDNTKNFMATTRKKFASLMRKKSLRKKTNLLRSIAIQTSETNLNDFVHTRKSLFRQDSLDDSFRHQSKPKALDLNDKPSTQWHRDSNKNQFDFNRIVESPKLGKSFSHKLMSAPSKVIKNIGQRPEENLQSYKFFDSGVNGDFTIAAMNDILGNLRARLETNEGAIHEVPIDEVAEEAREPRDDKEDAENSSAHISAQVDVHSEPLYAEIKDIEKNITNKAVQTSEVPRKSGCDDVTVIYAEVNKIRKLPPSPPFGNLVKKNNDPKLKTSSKSELSDCSDVSLGKFLDPNGKSESERSEIKHPSEENMISPISSSPTAPAEKLFKDEATSTSGISYDEPFEDQYFTPEEISDKDNRLPVVESVSKRDVAVQSQSKLPGFTPFGRKYDGVALPERSSSCPPSSDKSVLRKLSVSSDDCDVTDFNHSTSNCKSSNKTYQKFKTLKDKFRMSFRKGKIYLKNEKSRVSDEKSNSVEIDDRLWDQSDLGICQLYAMDATDPTSVQRKIEQAVNICRQMPQFESSTELVEAERLLLCSTLKYLSMKLPSPKKTPSYVKDCQLYIESFEIPFIPDAPQDTFFNYFYIGVFANGTDIKSTHSAERQSNKIVFKDCHITFSSLDPNFEVKIDIYVLRLRKMTSATPKKSVKKKHFNRSCNSSDSSDEILSRFRLHGSVVMTAISFAPYAIHTNCTRNLSSCKFCLHSSSDSYLFAISEKTRSIHLLRELRMKARIEIALKKFELEGFVNVQDDRNIHNWNRRWCKLDVLTLCFWDYPQDCNEKPCILRVDLTKCISFPIVVTDGTACAKQRSFSLKIITDVINCGTITSELFFAAENHTELSYWLDGLNNIGEFVKGWMTSSQCN